MNSTSLAFRRWETLPGVAPHVLFGETLGPGIYVLEFADGAEYVGQSLHPNSRFATHRRRFDDIVAVRFTPTRAAEMDRTEQALITARRDAGVELRNKTLLAQPFGASASLDSIIDQQEQAEWIDADPERARITIAPERIQLARERIAADPDRLPEPLREHPHARDAIESIATYVYEVIPSPAETESRGWVLSAWPSTNRSKNHRRFSTLSIQNVELFYLYEDLDDDGEWHQTMVLNVARTLRMSDEIEPYFEENSYRTTGPVWTAALSGWHDIGFLLSDPAVLLAARELALSQLRKGRAMFSRFHSETLADEVFKSIGDALDDGGADTLPL